MEDETKIKICGMKDPENIRMVVPLRPDFIGFILYPGSKRFVGNNYVLEADIPEEIKRVGVFVNALIRDVIHWINKLKLDYVQLHGVESVEYCRELKEMKFHVIKAFGIDEHFDFDVLKEYEPYCDFFLFDSKTPVHGGSGMKFPWKELEHLDTDHPFFLSGGIGPEDANEVLALKKRYPVYAIDLNSRFESDTCIKDADLLRRFIHEVRKTNQQK